MSLNIPSYTVEWRGTERRGALEPWNLGAGVSDSIAIPDIMSLCPHIMTDRCCQTRRGHHSWYVFSSETYLKRPLCYTKKVIQRNSALLQAEGFEGLLASLFIFQ